MKIQDVIVADYTAHIERICYGVIDETKPFEIDDRVISAVVAYLPRMALDSLSPLIIARLLANYLKDQSRFGSVPIQQIDSAELDELNQSIGSINQDDFEFHELHSDLGICIYVELLKKVTVRFLLDESAFPYTDELDRLDKEISELRADIELLNEVAA